VAAAPVELRPGLHVYVGQVPLVAEWQGGTAQAGRTMFVEPSAQLKELIEARNRVLTAQAAQPPAPQAYVHPVYAPQVSYAPQPGVPPQPAFAPPAAPAAPLAAARASTPDATIGVGGASAPLPAELMYRRQGANGNGSLLIALRHDTFANGAVVDGFVEFTALDSETIASIIVELVEVHKRGPSKGHVWDRMLVRQGPWRSQKGDVIPMPFQLRVPPGTSVSGRDVYWEIRGLVDIDWAFDVEATCPINMRNLDMERLRDALGALDYRIVDLVPEPLGQHFKGKFVPPAELRKQLGISDILLDVEYLGTNLKFTMEVEKNSFFKRDKQMEVLFDLERLRSAPLAEISAYLKQQIDAMMAA
jgi:hypothetical protein